MHITFLSGDCTISPELNTPSTNCQSIPSRHRVNMHAATASTQNTPYCNVDRCRYPSYNDNSKIR